MTLNVLCSHAVNVYSTVLHMPEPVAQSIRGSNYGSEGMGFDPHAGQSKVRHFSLSILTDKIVLGVQSCGVPTPPSTGSLVSV
jgi:hypothetical protein